MPALTIDATVTNFITSAQVLKQANIPSSVDTATLNEIDLARDAAQETVEGIVGPILWRSVTETVGITQSHPYYITGGLIVLSKKPVVSVQSVALVNSTATLTYTLDGPAGMLTNVHPWAWAFGGYASVTYTAGRTVCTSAMQLAALIIAVHLWQTQLGNTPAAGAFQEPAPDGTQYLAGYAIPNAAAELLNQHQTNTPLVG